MLITLSHLQTFLKLEILFIRKDTLMHVIILPIALSFMGDDIYLPELRNKQILIQQVSREVLCN